LKVRGDEQSDSVANSGKLLYARGPDCYAFSSNTISQTDQYENSFFVRTVVDWNHLADDNTIDAASREAFSRLAMQ